MSNRTLTLLMGFVAFLILIAGVVVIVVAVGGGGDDSGTPAGDSTPRPGGSASTPQICRGNTLILAGNTPTTIFDPIQVGDVTTSQYVVEIFGGLVTLDTDLKVQPDIAEKWEVSPDGKVYTFTLRRNVLFHNNRRVTAEDVKYSIERAADPREASPTVRAYLGNVVGIIDKYEGRANEVAGVRVKDQYTIEIELIEPSPYFLQELTYPVSYVVDREQIQNDPRNWTRRPNGTGPFRVAEYRPAELIRLVRHDRYHLGPAKIEEIRFEIAGGSIFTRYENNEIHIGFVPAQLLAEVQAGNSALSREYRAVPELATFYLTLNTNKPPFDDINVRRAFAMTVDRETINEVLFFGYYRVAEGFVPPGMPGYNPDVSTFPFNPEEARRLIQSSKYAGNLPRVVLTYSGGGGNPPSMLEKMVNDWRDLLGADVQLQAVESAAFLRELRRGTFDFVNEGWSADYPDPENFVGKLFYSQSPLNYTKYSKPEVDRLIEQARQENDPARRAELYGRAEQLIIDDAVVIPTFWSVDHVLVKDCVKNYPAAPMTIPVYRYVEIKAD